VVVIGLGRREDLVRRFDLVRMQDPFAVEPQGRASRGDTPETVGIADCRSDIPIESHLNDPTDAAGYVCLEALAFGRTKSALSVAN
jgi:hypothetical protein